jgi:hypothetical protein
MFRPYLGMELELARARADVLRTSSDGRRVRKPRPRLRVALGVRMIRTGERLLQEAR